MNLCNLDVQLRIEMRTEMAQLFRHLNTTVFHVTHDPSEAFAMADRIIVMNHGVIDQSDTRRIVIQIRQQLWLQDFLGAGNSLSAAEFDHAEGEYATVKIADRIVRSKTFFTETGAWSAG